MPGLLLNSVSIHRFAIPDPPIWPFEFFLFGCVLYDLPGDATAFAGSVFLPGRSGNLNGQFPALFAIPPDATTWAADQISFGHFVEQ